MISSIKIMKKTRGYTMLFAILLTMVVVTTGVSISNISRKELILSSSSRESTEAFYTAEGLVECVYMKDFQTNSTYDLTTLPSNFSIKCVDTNTNLPFVFGSETTIGGVQARQTQTLFVKMSTRYDDTSCASVFITKKVENTNKISTYINVRGYNRGWNPVELNCTQRYPGKVERAIQIAY